ncbi:methionyl-tRNA synthetase [Plasmodium vinckei petteri]|uniref:methionine--tRNA ligase n=1 Tax=Plasmodium vinckei petteri TaxID=138298 RepID=W7AMX2_PLAVN|nr:methionyl-tRNA synthetase [Plasmodium vinckei petteri]EUD72643.1 methionyl-tRNA synthetase [Plasmodium vinckei petteri]CAD2109247.1 methionine--tRNA ligase, putative [Plasmodium vinckei petteri]
MKFFFFFFEICLIIKICNGLNKNSYIGSLNFENIKNVFPSFFSKIKREKYNLKNNNFLKTHLKKKQNIYQFLYAGDKPYVLGRKPYINIEKKKKKNEKIKKLSNTIEDELTNTSECYNKNIKEVFDYVKRNDENKKGLVITTPIYYGNDKPHIGHAYCNVLVDVIYRFEKIKDKENKNKIIFFSGMDEHGLKIDNKTKELNMDKNNYLNNISEYYKKMNELLNVDINLFYRTSNVFHKTFVQHVWKYLLSKGYIYKDIYKGYYSISEERYLSDREVEKMKSEKSSITTNNIIYIEEENSYFFDINKFKDFLINFYKTNENIIFPSYLKKEIEYHIENDFKNVCISRYNTEWGIKIPGEANGTIYVWFEALLSYISSILYVIKKYENAKNESSKVNSTFLTNVIQGEEDIVCTYEDVLSLVDTCSSFDSSENAPNLDKTKMVDKNWSRKLFEKMWNPYIQVIGKDILKFHGILYICLLNSLGIKIPEHILCHGLIKNENQKMSKSLNNIVSPFTLLEKYNKDVIRLYFIGSGNIYEDKNFKDKNLETFELFLRNSVGNLLYRIVSLCIENNYKIVKKNDLFNFTILNEFKNCKTNLIKLFENMEYPLLLEKLMILVKKINKYFVHNEPWNKLNDLQNFNLIIYETFECIKFFSIFMYPFIPNVSLSILKNIGFEEIDHESVSIDMLNEETDKFVLNNLIKII